MRCGKGQHSRHSCPARDATCHRCQRKGHYSSQCRSRTVAEVESSTEEESCMDTAYIDTLSQAAESWKVKLRVSGRVIEFKVDTGAEVTAVSDTAFGTMRIKH